MSRSRKKTPIFGNAGGSDKKDKRLANRALRKTVHQALTVPEGVYYEEVDISAYFDKQDTSNEWSFRKDGKHYFKKATDKDMRK